MSANSGTTIERQFQEAVNLAQRGRRAQALQLFEGCLSLAVQQGVALSVEQLAALLQEIAWCYGDMGRWEESRRLYAQIESLLSQVPGWQRAAPEGIRVTIPEGYDPAPKLAALYESLGIAYDNAGDMAQAMDYYRRAVERYTALGNLPKAATVWHHVALGCQRRRDWQGLQRAAERMLELWTHTNGIYGQVWAWQYLAQAHAHQGDLRQALVYMERAVEAERLLGHRDLPRDEQILAELRQAYARTLRGLLGRLLRKR